MRHDPAVLAARVARGDERAFAQLVEATIARVHRLCARMLGDAAEAEDVTQEVYVKAHDALLRGDFDGRAKVETWLHRIAVNAALNALRARRARVAHPPGEGDTAIDGVREADARLALAQLGRWLDALPESQRAALVLKELEGWTSAETAEILGISEGSVEQRLVRARATLRERIGRD
jgi:RNA polymerase sigma-70 factor (ECF subfamily)